LAYEIKNLGIDFSESLNGIKIKAVNENNQEYIAIVDNYGYYEFRDMPRGKYKLSIDHYSVKFNYDNKFPQGYSAIEPTYDGMTKVIYLNGSNKNVDMGNTFRLNDMVYV
jgi:hypothetical protein